MDYQKAWKDQTTTPALGYAGSPANVAASQQARVDTQLERLQRICQGLAEMNSRLNYVNIKIRGQVPEPGNKTEMKEPEITLVGLGRVAELLLERCHIQVNELAAQIGE